MRLRGGRAGKALYKQPSARPRLFPLLEDQHRSLRRESEPSRFLSVVPGPAALAFVGSLEMQILRPVQTS